MKGKWGFVLGRTYVLTLTALLVPWLAWSASLEDLWSASLEDLLAKKTRPTMQDIAQSLPALEVLESSMAAPPPRQRRKKQLQWPPPQVGGQLLNPRNQPVGPFINTLIQGAPFLIAAMEKAFPHATWAFIGRDSQLIGDIVEAFYFSLGQTDRVARIGVSKQTFNPTPSDPVIVDFLEGQGLDLKNVAAKHPFILVDTISQGYGRQAREMIAAVYKTFRHGGYNPAQLLRKVNIFGLKVSTFTGNFYDVAHSDAFLSREEARYARDHVGDYFQEHMVMTFAEPIRLFNETGYEHYTFAWHGPFDSLRQNASGRWVAYPGPAHDNDMRLAILAQQKDVFHAARTQGFRKLVEKEATRLGYQFPLQRAPLEPAKFQKIEDDVPPEMKALLAELERAEEEMSKSTFNQGDKLQTEELRLIVKGMHKAEKGSESPTEVTANGEALLSWYRENKPKDPAGLKQLELNRFGLEVFRALRWGRKGLRLRGEDLRAVAREVFANVEPTFSLLDEVRAFAEEAKAFADMMTYDDWIAGKEGFKTYSVLKTLYSQKGSCAQLIARVPRVDPQ